MAGLDLPKETGVQPPDKPEKISFSLGEINLLVFGSDFLVFTEGNRILAGVLKWILKSYFDENMLMYI